MTVSPDPYGTRSQPGLIPARGSLRVLVTFGQVLLLIVFAAITASLASSAASDIRTLTGSGIPGTMTVEQCRSAGRSGRSCQGYFTADAERDDSTRRVWSTAIVQRDWTGQTLRGVAVADEYASQKFRTTVFLDDDHEPLWLGVAVTGMCGLIWLFGAIFTFATALERKQARKRPGYDPYGLPASASECHPPT